MNRYSVTVSITLEIDAESESDARRIAYNATSDSTIWSAFVVDSVSKCEEGK